MAAFSRRPKSDSVAALSKRVSTRRADGAKGFTDDVCSEVEGSRASSTRAQKCQGRYKKLSDAMEKRAGETVQQAALIRGDKRIASLIRHTTDFAALEIK